MVVDVHAALQTSSAVSRLRRWQKRPVDPTRHRVHTHSSAATTVDRGTYLPRPPPEMIDDIITLGRRAVDA
ncbi:hypothetical protein RU01_02880 [Rhodococcus sp. MEB064]|nr:hypothetical protein RU01_02880 [Rhodococcus sp. MEB064]